MKTQEKKYSWSYKDNKINCCASQTSTCTVTNFWEVAELTAFHDVELQQATKEINAILEDIKKGNKEPQRDLSFIQIKDRHFLAWTNGIVGPDDDDDIIHKMLRLKAK